MMEKYFHGENSITFSLFNDLNEQEISRLLSHAIWNDFKSQKNQEIDLTRDRIKYVHLFPCFGKKYGYGEPDAIILTDKHVVFVEVELMDLSIGQSMPKPFQRQMSKFVLLAQDLVEAKTKRLREQFVGKSGFKFYGKRPLRRLFKQIQASAEKEKKEYMVFLAISDGKRMTKQRVNEIASGVGLDKRIFGWIGFRQIMYMKKISNKPKDIIREILCKK